LRVALAIRDGQKQIAVEYVDLTPAEEKAVLATLDPLAELRTLNQSGLDALLQSVAQDTPALEGLVKALGGIPPEFVPVSEDEQGRLDQKTPIKCPACGHEFTT